MSTLTNTKIKDTYSGLIKTADNLPVDATPKALEDGVGNALPIEVGTDRINFTDTVDFTGATVIGLPEVNPPGLISGGVANSMKSAPSLTTTAAIANGTGSIVLGNAATAAALFDVVAIGANAIASGFANEAIAIGTGTSVGGNGAIAIGNAAAAESGGGIAIGTAAKSKFSLYSTAIGRNAIANSANSMAIGLNTITNATGAVALGADITAATVDTVTIKKLQMLDYATLDYVDDAAAATGGIPLGGVYHTSGALKIRIV
jgi:trimeric autotransporter adhesin